MEFPEAQVGFINTVVEKSKKMVRTQGAIKPTRCAVRKTVQFSIDGVAPQDTLQIQFVERNAHTLCARITYGGRKTENHYRLYF